MYPPQGGYGAGRGRGGAGSRGGRGGGGGGRGRGSSLKTDYTSVRPIDYALVNKERYKTMTGKLGEVMCLRQGILKR